MTRARATPQSWIETDAATGKSYLKLPVPGPATVQRLADALDRPKPFRRFKDALLDPSLRQAWFAFEGAAHASLAQAWCEANEIEVEWV